MTTLYSDKRIVCDEDGITIRWYRFPFGDKRIPYSAIHAVKQRELSRLERWRIWGSLDLRNWFNLDLRRPKKTKAVVIDMGRWTRAVITPDDTDSVTRILQEKTGRPS